MPMTGRPSIFAIIAGVFLLPARLPAAGVAVRPVVWEPDYQTIVRAPTAFVQAVEDFLTHEGLDAKSVQIELAGLQDLSQGRTDAWRALADVHVKEDAQGRPIRRLILDPDYWLDSARPRRFLHHRWPKVLWHEIH